ncbi:MAG: DsbA family protein [Sulfurifustis sp.]
MPRLIRYLFLLLLLSSAVAVAEDSAPAARPNATRSNRSSSVVQGAAPPAIMRIGAEPFVRVDPDRARGDSAATVAIVEFADYQCPYCRAFHNATLPKLDAVYIKTGKVRYFYVDFPLSMHAQAFGASVAARCAAAQGQYRTMQDSLYAEQARLGDALYDELARRIGLDVESFRACRRSEATRRLVDRDVSEAHRLGIEATPSFALGRIEGDRVIVKRTAVGTPSFDVFAKEIDALLQ